MSRLPNSVQDVADVIGEESALLLVSNAKRSYPPSRGEGRAELVQVYVPTERRMPATHELVRVLGWNTAVKLARHFGGEILTLGNCADLRRQHRNQAMRRMAKEGASQQTLAQWFEVTTRTVANVLAEGKRAEPNV